jgi:hypothetical protein
MAESAQWVEGWEKDRARGPMRYVLRVGILGFGTAMFVANLFTRPPAVLTVVGVLARALLWAVGGFIFGSLLWLVNERRYRKYMATQLPPSSN